MDFSQFVGRLTVAEVEQWVNGDVDLQKNFLATASMEDRKNLGALKALAGLFCGMDLTNVVLEVIRCGNPALYRHFQSNKRSMAWLRKNVARVFA